MTKTVLVTGGARGIGRGIALAFGAAGWNVVVNDIGPADDTIAALGPHGAYVHGDIAAIDGHEALLNQAEAAFGTLDALVNNAGISVASRGDILDITPANYDRQLAVNLRGPFFLTQALARRWVAAPGPRRAIITVSSANAVIAAPERAEYCISKTGLAMMTKLFAVRLADAGISVFEIRPGIIRTDMTAVAAARYDALIANGVTPIRRWGEPGDIAAAAVALASGAFAFSTGEAINVDGGLHIARL